MKANTMPVLAAILLFAGGPGSRVLFSAETAELLPNGGFESGADLWTEVSWLGWPLILDSSVLQDPFPSPQAGRMGSMVGRRQ